MIGQRSSILIAGLFLAASSLLALGATPADKPQAETASEPVQEPKRPCSRCGIIEAISQRIVPGGINGFYAYDLFVRMEKTELLKIVPVTTVGAMKVGDRVQVLGGVAQPYP